MTASSWWQPDQHQKGRLCSWQRCSLISEQDLEDSALWFGRRECDAKMWLRVAGHWDYDLSRSNHPSDWIFYACSWLSAEYCCKALYGRFCSTHWDIQWIFGKLKSASNSLETSITWLIKYLHVFISRQSLDSVQVLAFVSLVTFRLFMSSVFRGLDMAFTVLPARPSKIPTWNVWKCQKASSMELIVASSWDIYRAYI